MKSTVLAMAVAGVELHLNASRVDRILAQLKFLSERASADSQNRDRNRYYKKGYDFGSD